MQQTAAQLENDETNSKDDISTSPVPNPKVILFVGSGGVVGKTTLSLNLANWLDSKSMNVLYMEILGNSEIDSLLKSKGFYSTLIEYIFAGRQFARPFFMPINDEKTGKLKSPHIAYVSLKDVTNDKISQSSVWKMFWRKYITLTSKTEYISRIKFNTVVINTNIYQIPTQHLSNFVTDVVVVTDICDTKEEIIQKDIRTMMEVLKIVDRKDANFHVVANFFDENAINNHRYKEICAEINAIGESYEILVNHIKIPLMPSAFGSIVLDEKKRKVLLKDLIPAIYGTKV